MDEFAESGRKDGLEKGRRLDRSSAATRDNSIHNNSNYTLATEARG